MAVRVKPLALLPSLDEIARNPHCVAGLPQSTVRDLLRRLAVAQSTLVVELDKDERPHRDTPVANDRMLTAHETAEIIRCKPRWIHRHANRLPFVRRVSARKILCSEAGVRAWLATRKA
jgi:hypothetical protein